VRATQGVGSVPSQLVEVFLTIIYWVWLFGIVFGLPIAIMVLLPSWGLDLVTPLNLCQSALLVMGGWIIFFKAVWHFDW